MDGLSQRVAEVRTRLEPLGGRGWLVGGGLRDLLLGRPVTDVDVALEGDARAAARRLAKVYGAGCYELSPSFRAWRVHGGDLPFTIDLTPLQGGSISEDLQRRDLTINALAMPIAPGTDERPLDLFEGLRDLAARRMRMVSPTAFAQDPVRLLRLARQTTQLGFSIDPGTVDQARNDAARLWESPGERIFDEVVRMISTNQPVGALRVCDELGILSVLCSDGDTPETEAPRRVQRAEALWGLLTGLDGVLPEHAGMLRRALEGPLADGLSRRDALMIACLWEDVPDASAAVDRWCRRLRTSSRVREQLVHIAAGGELRSQIGEDWSDAHFYRAVTAAAPAALEVAILGVAGASIDRRELAVAWARSVVEMHARIDERAADPALIAGDDLARALERNTGPWLREALEHVREAQLIRGLATRDEAIALVRTFLREVRTDPE